MRTVSKPDGLYGCNTEHPDYKPRKDGRWIQDGWTSIPEKERQDYKINLDGVEYVGIDWTTASEGFQVCNNGEFCYIRLPIMKWIPDRMSRECDYDRWECDPYCKGCKKANGRK